MTLVSAESLRFYRDASYKRLCFAIFVVVSNINDLAWMTDHTELAIHLMRYVPQDHISILYVNINFVID